MKRIAFAALILCACSKDEPERCRQTVDVTGRMCSVELAYDGKVYRDTIIGRLEYNEPTDTLAGTSRYNIAHDKESEVTVRVCHLRTTGQDGPISVSIDGDCGSDVITSADSCAVLSF